MAQINITAGVAGAVLPIVIADLPAAQFVPPLSELAATRIGTIFGVGFTMLDGIGSGLQMAQIVLNRTKQIDRLSSWTR
jgi:hypothetical protein